MHFLKSIFGFSLKHFETHLHRKYGRKCSSMPSDAGLELDECYKLVSGLVDEAAEVLRKAGSRGITYKTKANEMDLVTELDGQVERLLIAGIRERYPSHKFIAEEGSSGIEQGQQLTDEPTWIIDPIDGTMNFVHGFPFSCISIGLYVRKLAELAIVYNPMLKQKYVARRGCGAYLNGARIRASGQKDMSMAMVINEFNNVNVPTPYMKVIIDNAKNMLRSVHAMRATGSAVMDLCLVAQGAVDAYYEFAPHVWDVAAGALIVREAGGVVVDTTGKNLDIMARRVLAAATTELACDIANVLGDNQISHARDDEPPAEQQC